MPEDQIKALLSDASQYLVSRDLDQAIRLSRAVLVLDPNNAEAAQILRTALKTKSLSQSLDENPSPEEENISKPLDSHNEPKLPNPPKESADAKTGFEKLMEGIWKIFSIIPFPIKVLVIGSFIVSLTSIETKETFGWVTMGIGILMAGSALGLRGGSWNWNWNRWVMNLKWGLVLFFMGLMNFPCQVLEASP